SHEDKYLDCKTFDSGRSGIEFNRRRIENAFSKLPYAFAEAMFDAKAAASPFERSVPNPVSAAIGLGKNYEEMLKWYSDETRLLAVDRTLGRPAWLHEKEALDRKRAYAASETSRLGGMDSVVFGFLPAEGRAAPDISAQMVDVLAKFLA